MDPAAPRRPRSVTAAGAVALGGCAVVATFLVVVWGLVLTRRDVLPEGLRVGLLLWLTGGCVLWCLGAGVLAWRTLQGSPRARSGLVVSAALAGSLSLTASAYVAGALLPLLACAVTMVLLLSSSSRVWFRSLASG